MGDSADSRLGRRLRTLRLRKGLSCAEVARLVQVPSVVVGRVERGERGLRATEFLAWAQALNEAPSDLLKSRRRSPAVDFADEVKAAIVHLDRAGQEKALDFIRYLKLEDKLKSRRPRLAKRRAEGLGAARSRAT